MDRQIELQVVTHDGTKGFRYIESEGREILFRRLMPFDELLYGSLTVLREGREIGSSEAYVLGTHAAIYRFSTGGLGAIFPGEAVPEPYQWIDSLRAKDFEAGDILKVSCPFLKENASSVSYTHLTLPTNREV